MKAYPSYKESTIEWLGKVPEGWAVKRVKWLCNVKRGQSPRPIDDSSYFDDNGEYAWVRISDVTASDKYLYQTEQKLSELGASKSVKLEPDELFVSIAATVGKPIINKIKCCIHDGFVWLEGLDQSKDFFYFVFSGGELYKGLGKIGTQLNLNSEYIANIYVPVPPRDEQKIIVKYLERKTAQIDALIEKKQQQIDLLQEQRTALINHAVTKGLNPDVRMKDSGVEWLGEIPSHWETKKLKHLISLIIDNRGRTPPFGDTGVPMLEVKQVTEGNRYPSENFEKFVEEQIMNQYVRKHVEEGDILLSTVGATSGRAALVDSNPRYFIAQNLIGIRATDDVYNLFLYYIITSDYFINSLFSINKANTIDNLKVSVFINNDCAIPDYPEQQTIATYLDDKTKKIDQLIEKLKNMIEYYKEYRTALISEAVTGKIDVRTAV